MITPIFDFVKQYSESKTARFHMPGHKGVGLLGVEKYDITEIFGADVLYSADGIINESENNLSSLYGTAHSFYSTEGSTIAIKAMLALVSEREGDERPLILAARNVHTAFIKAAALLDLEVEFIYPERAGHLCRCDVTADDVERSILSAGRKPSAVYLTSPDYLGNMLDIKSIALVCRENGIPLLVDNAHGAYLRFLPEDQHPITLGAAMCADSAHKTLPVLTGGAYLHISPDYPEYVEGARGTLSLFASTSPSYLTLSSLDLCNKYLSEDFGDRLSSLCCRISTLKDKIKALGFSVMDSEPLKIVIRSGGGLSDQLRDRNIEVEYSDGEYTVLMLTVENSDSELEALLDALSEIKPQPVNASDVGVMPHDREMSIRNAVFAKSELVSVEKSAGRISASPTVSCPPAIPIVVSGERIIDGDILLFKRYGIDKVRVVIE